MKDKNKKKKNSRINIKPMVPISLFSYKEEKEVFEFNLDILKQAERQAINIVMRNKVEAKFLLFLIASEVIDMQPKEVALNKTNLIKIALEAFKALVRDEWTLDPSCPYTQDEIIASFDI